MKNLPSPASWQDDARYVQERIDGLGDLGKLKSLEPAGFARALLRHFQDAKRRPAVYRKSQLPAIARQAAAAQPEQATWEQDVVALALDETVIAASNPYGSLRQKLDDAFSFFKNPHHDPEAIHGLNRCRWFISLARCYWLKQDPAIFHSLMWHWDYYASKVADPDEKTIAALQSIGPDARKAPPYHSLNSYIRLTSWWHAFWLSIHAKEMTPQRLVTNLARSLRLIDYVHAHGVRQQEHNFTSMQMQGLFYWAVSLPEFSGMHTLAVMTRNTLEYSLQRALLADGSQWELSISYHIGCIGWYGGPALLGARLKHPFNPAYLDLLGRMGDVVDQLIEDDTHVVPLSDSDRRSNWRQGLAKIAQLFPEKAFLHKALPDWETTWLMAGKVNDRPRVRKAKAGVTVFPVTNMAVARTGNRKKPTILVFDNGPSNAGHSHMDQLSLYWNVQGSATLLDPGRWIYDHADPDRHWVLAMQSHNTIWPANDAVSAKDLLHAKVDIHHPVAARLLPGDPRMGAIESSHRDGAAIMQATFRGYAQHADASSTRSVAVSLDDDSPWLVVVDRFASDRPLRWCNSWLTPGQEKVAIEKGSKSKTINAGSWSASLGDGRTLHCQTLADHAITLASRDAFWTPDYSIKSPAQYMLCHAKVARGVRVHLFTLDADAQVDARLVKDAVQIKSGGKTVMI